MASFQSYILDLVQMGEVPLQAFTQLFELTSYEKGQPFAVLGECSRRVAYIEAGVLRAYHVNDRGEEYNKTFFTEHMMVGAYSSLITGSPNRVNIDCLTDCKVWVADYHLIEELYDQYREVERFARRLAELFFVRKEKREIELATLEAKDRYLIFQQEHPGLEQRIPQYHIASYLGVSATQLSRIRSKR